MDQLAHPVFLAALWCCCLHLAFAPLRRVVELKRDTKYKGNMFAVFFFLFLCAAVPKRSPATVGVVPSADHAILHNQLAESRGRYVATLLLSSTEKQSRGVLLRTARKWGAREQGDDRRYARGSEGSTPTWRKRRFKGKGKKERGNKPQQKRTNKNKRQERSLFTPTHYFPFPWLLPFSHLPPRPLPSSQHTAKRAGKLHQGHVVLCTFSRAHALLNQEGTYPTPQQQANSITPSHYKIDDTPAVLHVIARPRACII